MGKFNIEKFRGLNNEEAGTSVGAGLLNEASREKEADKLKIIYISRDQIDTNDRNFYSIGNIDSLKKSIETIGLKEPLMVHQKSDGRYKLLGGERRLTAIDQLIEEGRWKQEIPCVQQDYDKVNLPVPDELKEIYCIITTNREQRDYTDADLANEIRELKTLYACLRESGIDDIIIGMSDSGDEIHRQIKGIKTKDLLAKDLGVSTGRIASFDKVENNGTDALKKAVQENRISIVAADAAASLSPEEQNELVATHDRIKPSDVTAFKSKLKSGKKAPAVQVIDMNDSEHKKEFLRLIEAEHQGRFRLLSEQEYKAYKKAVKSLEKILLKE